MPSQTKTPVPQGQFRTPCAARADGAAVVAAESVQFSKPLRSLHPAGCTRRSPHVPRQPPSQRLLFHKLNILRKEL